jgi:hypothetical protein
METSTHGSLAMCRRFCHALSECSSATAHSLPCRLGSHQICHPVLVRQLRMLSWQLESMRLGSCRHDWPALRQTPTRTAAIFPPRQSQHNIRAALSSLSHLPRQSPPSYISVMAINEWRVTATPCESCKHLHLMPLSSMATPLVTILYIHCRP